GNQSVPAEVDLAAPADARSDHRDHTGTGGIDGQAVAFLCAGSGSADEYQGCGPLCNHRVHAQPVFLVGTGDLFPGAVHCAGGGDLSLREDAASKQRRWPWRSVSTDLAAAVVVSEWLMRFGGIVGFSFLQRFFPAPAQDKRTPASSLHPRID